MVKPGRGQNCTNTSCIKGKFYTKILLHKHKFARGEKIARRKFCTTYGGSYLYKSKKKSRNSYLYKKQKKLQHKLKKKLLTEGKG